MSTKTIERRTNETDIQLSLNLLGEGKSEIDTGIGFLDHMLELFSFHAQFDLIIKARGDLNVDDHHTVEDVGIVLGQAFYQALQDLSSRGRYGVSYVPMDEALVRTVVDISNRSTLVFNAVLTHPRLGRMDTQNIKEFFTAFVRESRINLHVEVLYGENDHHKVEGIFKSVGRALKIALSDTSHKVQSTKGVL